MVIGKTSAPKCSTEKFAECRLATQKIPIPHTIMITQNLQLFSIVSTFPLYSCFICFTLSHPLIMLTSTTDDYIRPKSVLKQMKNTDFHS